jgi:hypothetical protein
VNLLVASNGYTTVLKASALLLAGAISLSAAGLIILRLVAARYGHCDAKQNHWIEFYQRVLVGYTVKSTVFAVLSMLIALIVFRFTHFIAIGQFKILIIAIMTVTALTMTSSLARALQRIAHAVQADGTQTLIGPTIALDRLKEIRGRFGVSDKNRFIGRALAATFGVICPAILLGAAYESWSPGSGFNESRWACIVGAGISVGLAVFVWLSQRRDWEFTGEQVIARRCGSIQWRLPLDSALEGRIESTASGSAWLHLVHQGHRYSILLNPNLLRLLVVRREASS